jgi:hypothetical protein
MALARTHPSDGNWRWLCNLVKESAAEPEAALHLLQQIQMGTLSLTSLRDAQRLAGILCPRAIVALAHYRRYKSTHLAKRRAEEATPRHANSQSDPLGEPTPHCDRCSGPVEVGQPTCNLCGPPPAPPAPSFTRRQGDTPPPRPSPKIVIKIDDAALASFPECLPFPQPPTRPKHSGRKRK